MTKEQFSELMLQYERLVYTVCFQLVRDAAAAEDLLEAYHRRLDIYHEYSGMNNLCTVNKAPGERLWRWIGRPWTESLMC